MANAELAATLQSRLNLSSPPVALTLVQEPPAGVPHLDLALPASCAFWRRAQTELFFATAADHFHCPLGAHVMGFALPEAKMSELMAEVGRMCEVTYVREEEVPRVPRIPQEHAGAVYGPLASFPLTPDAVILWTTPLQAMVLSECSGLVNWADTQSTILGRPGCAAIPQALSREQPALSFGCVGMRMFSEAPGDQFLLVLPGKLLHGLGDDLFVTLEVHRQMREYYLHRAANLTRAGSAPSS